MTIRGDMQAALVSKGFSWDQANDIVRTVIEATDDPNFACRYARFEGFETDDEENELMCRYWAVVTFLKSLT